MAVQLEQVRGEVEATNATGVCVGGQWLNVSRFRKVDISAVQAGQTISATVERSDRGVYLRDLDVVGSAPAPETPAVLGDATSTRLAVLEAAAGFLGQMAQCREDVRSEHVLVLAERWLAWLEPNHDHDRHKHRRTGPAA
jgi:hypothetical protein